MATYSNIGLSQPAASTITKVVASVTVDRGSTTEHQEIMTLAGAESSLEIARVVASAPASTAYGLVVREASPTTSVRVHQSSGDNLHVTVDDVVNRVTIQSTAANALVTAYQSTQSNFRATIYQSTADDLQVAWPSTAQVIVSNLSTNITISAPASTFRSGVMSSAESTIVSSGTDALSVYSFNLGLSPTSSQTVRWLQGSTTEMWRHFFHSTAVGPGITKDAQPGLPLFRVSSNNALALASSGGTAPIHYWVGFVRE